MRKLALLIAVVGAVGAGPQQPVFRAVGEAVLVDVSVLDGRKPVQGLRAEDFDLRDKGTPQQVLDASRESASIDASILLDDSGSANSVFGGSLASAAESTRRVFDANDHVEVIVFGGVIVEASLWTGRSLGSWAGLVGRDQGTSLFDALMSSMVRSPLSGRRRLIIALSDGMDSSSYTSRDIRLRVLDRSDAVVQMVAIGFVSNAFSQVGKTDPRRAGDGRYLMQEIADRSGGRFFDLASDQQFLEGIRAAIADFRTRYVLRYVPTGVDSAGWHDLVVHVKGHNYTIHSRKGYVRD